MVRFKPVKTLITLTIAIIIAFLFLTSNRDAANKSPVNQNKGSSPFERGKRVELERLLVHDADRSKYEYLSTRIKDYCSLPYEKIGGVEGKVDSRKYRVIGVHVVMGPGHHRSEYSKTFMDEALASVVNETAYDELGHEGGKRFVAMYKSLRPATVEKKVGEEGEGREERSSRGELTALGAVQSIVYGQHAGNVYGHEWRVFESESGGGGGGGGGDGGGGGGDGDDDDKTKKQSGDGDGDSKKGKFTVRSVGTEAAADTVSGFVFGVWTAIEGEAGGAEKLLEEVRRAYESRDGKTIVNENGGKNAFEFEVRFSTTPNLCFNSDKITCACDSIEKLRAKRDATLYAAVTTAQRSRTLCTMLETPMKIVYNGTFGPQLFAAAHYGGAAIAAVDVETAKADDFRENCVLSLLMDTFLPHLCYTHEFACKPGTNSQTQQDRLLNCIQPLGIEKLFDVHDYFTYQLFTMNPHYSYSVMYAYPFLVDIVEAIQRKSRGVHLHVVDMDLFRSIIRALDQRDGRQLGFASRLHIEVLESIDDGNLYLRFVHQGEDVTRKTIGCDTSPCSSSRFISAFEKLPSIALHTYDAQQTMEASESTYNSICRRFSTIL